MSRRELSAMILRLKAWTPLSQPSACVHRKPRWVPVARSKIYRIPKRPVLPEEEKVELKRITDNYHTKMRALRYFYHEQMLKEKSSQLDTTSEQYLQQEALDFESCMKMNDTWNAERAEQRERRLAEEYRRMQERALTIMDIKDQKRKQQIERANELVRREKEASKSFITAETLDAAIEHALANPTDYNFCIDLQGNKHVGRETNSSYAKREQEQESAVN